MIASFIFCFDIYVLNIIYIFMESSIVYQYPGCEKISDRNYRGEGIHVSNAASHLFKDIDHSTGPYRLTDFRLGLFLDGGADSLVNLMPSGQRPGEIGLLTPGTLYEIERVDSACKVVGIVIKPGVLLEAMGGNVPAVFQQYAFRHKMLLREDEREVFCKMVDSLFGLLSIESEKSPAVFNQIAAIFHFAGDIFSRDTRISNNIVSREGAILNEFMRLLSQSKGVKHKVSDYAAQMCISEHYLSVSVKNASGMTVKEWIDKAVVDEIKILLRSTNLTISQISDRLAFPNSSFLCKFFKQREGMTPLEYRGMIIFAK